MSDSTNLLRQIESASNGDHRVFGELVEQYRPRLRRMVFLRMDQRLRHRVDASDILQDAFLEASRRLAEYLRNPTMPFGLWLRFITGQKLLQVHRQHLGAQARDVSREISIDRAAAPQVSSAVLAARLVGHFTSPSMNLIREEMKKCLQNALNEMEEMDREIIALKHFEQLSLSEAAIVMDIKHTAACNRYVRALRKLKDRLGDDVFFTDNKP